MTQMDRYHTDPEYRALILARQRERYKTDPATRACKLAHSARLRSDPIYRTRHNEHRDARRRKSFEWFREFKDGLSCIICGESHPAVLDFHHRDPSEKSDLVSRMVQLPAPVETILAEISKCHVLCANCHRKLHWEESRSLGEINQVIDRSAPPIF